MKTALQITEIVRKHLIDSILFIDADRPSGHAYAYKYPSGSEKEDVTVAVLTNVPDQSVNEGIVNVNIFVPNLSITKADGSSDNSLPNVPRLADLSSKAITALSEVWALSGEYTFNVQQEMLMEDDETNKHFANIRVEFYSINN